jgi:ferritin-like protein
LPAASTTFHEDVSVLQPATLERHRAIVSLQEELEAIDWYDQRIDATGDDDLREILRHNRDEEKEHAVMTLEWLRRHDPELDLMLRRYLFKEGPIVDEAFEPPAGGSAPAPTGATTAPSRPADGSLGIGAPQKEEL